jgi:hypothetical protein
MGHEPIVLARASSIEAWVQKAETETMTHASEQTGRAARRRAPRSAHSRGPRRDRRHRYADQNERDHEALVSAIDAGRITADPDR